MTFDQYINNPMGRKNFVYSNRMMYKSLYSEKLDKILVREVGKVQYTLYTSKKDEYYVHLKIPSEVVPDFYYDTVIQFYTTHEHFRASRSLKDYDVKFYSNDPSFVFTFAHAMLSNDLFIRDLVPRMSKEAVKKVAKERNPKDEVGYVKSIYFAYLTMVRYSLFDKINYKSYAKPYSQKELLANVVHADIKVKDRVESGERIRKEKTIKKKEKSDSKPSISNTISSRLPSNNLSKTINRVKSTNMVKNIKKITRASSSKRTKKI